MHLAASFARPLHDDHRDTKRPSSRRLASAAAPMAAVVAVAAVAPPANAADVGPLEDSGLLGAQSCFVSLTEDEAKAYALYDTVALERLFIVASKTTLTPEQLKRLDALAANESVVETLISYENFTDVAPDVEAAYERAVASLEDAYGPDTAGTITDIVAAQARTDAYLQRVESGRANSWEFELFPGETANAAWAEMGYEGWDEFAQNPGKVFSANEQLDLTQDQIRRFNEEAPRVVDLPAAIAYERANVAATKQADKACAQGGNVTVSFPTEADVNQQGGVGTRHGDGPSPAGEPLADTAAPPAVPARAENTEQASSAGKAVAIALGVLAALGLLVGGAVAVAPRLGITLPSQLQQLL